MACALPQGRPEPDADAVRMAALQAVVEADCRTTIPLPGGGPLHIPLFLAGEAALAARAGRSEAAWRRDWARQQLERAARFPDNAAVLAEVVAILCWTERIIREQKLKGVWPWEAAGACGAPAVKPASGWG